MEKLFRICDQSGEVLAKLVPFNCPVDLIFCCQTQFMVCGKTCLYSCYIRIKPDS